MNVRVVEPKARRRDRRFPRIEVPLRGTINHRPVTVRNWSINGVGLTDLGSVLLRPETHVEIEIHFDNGAASVSSTFAARVVWVDMQLAAAGLEFHSLSSRQKAFLQESVDQYLRGGFGPDQSKLKPANDPLPAQAAPLPPQHRAGSDHPAGPVLRERLLGMVVFAIVGAAAFTFLSSLIYERLFLFDASMARVSAPTIQVISPSEGKLTRATGADDVALNTPIARLERTSRGEISRLGRTLDIVSPCDCFLVSTPVQPGSLVRAGDTIAVLVAKDAPTSVVVRTRYANLSRIDENTTVRLRYIDGVRVPSARIVQIENVNRLDSSQVSVTVEAGRDLGAEFTGQPVDATFDTAPSLMKGWF
ncbi:MAG: PilZ domain-containing protein [Pseudomonadota bacterium]